MILMLLLSTCRSKTFTLASACSALSKSIKCSADIFPLLFIPLLLLLLLLLFIEVIMFMQRSKTSHRSRVLPSPFVSPPWPVGVSEDDDKFEVEECRSNCRMIKQNALSTMKTIPWLTLSWYLQLLDVGLLLGMSVPNFDIFVFHIVFLQMIEQSWKEHCIVH